LQHPVHWLPDSQHRSHGALCPAHWRHHFLSHVRFFRALHAGCVFSACPSRGVPSASANLRRKSPPRNLEWRSVVGSPRRRSGIGPGICPVHRDLYKSFSLGVANLRNKTRPLIVCTGRTRPRAAQNPQMPSMPAPLLPNYFLRIALTLSPTACYY
jgi:hypothetical protein